MCANRALSFSLATTMTVIKLTSSKKAILVIDDDGNSFITSLHYWNELLRGNNKQGFLLMQRLPEKVSDSRFKRSPEYGNKPEPVAPSGDALSKTSRQEKAVDGVFVDVKDW
jgi:hypothetical protein